MGNFLFINFGDTCVDNFGITVFYPGFNTDLATSFRYA